MFWTCEPPLRPKSRAKSSTADHCNPLCMPTGRKLRPDSFNDSYAVKLCTHSHRCHSARKLHMTRTNMDPRPTSHSWTSFAKGRDNPANENGIKILLTCQTRALWNRANSIYC